MTHTSVVTPSANPRPNSKASLKASTAMNGNGHIKLADAIESFFEWGSNMAGVDGNIVRALKFWGTDSKEDKAARSDLWKAMNCGYLVRKLGYTRDHAAVVYGRMKYNSKNPDKNTDDHRTAEEQRVIDTCRQMKSRAMALAGISDQTQAQRDALESAQETREQKKRETEAREARLAAADELVNPPAEKDIFEVLAGLVTTLQNLRNKYAKTLVGDAGSAWRDWIANAPIGTKPANPAKKK